MSRTGDARSPTADRPGDEDEVANRFFQDLDPLLSRTPRAQSAAAAIPPTPPPMGYEGLEQAFRANEESPPPRMRPTSAPSNANPLGAAPYGPTQRRAAPLDSGRPLPEVMRDLFKESPGFEAQFNDYVWEMMKARMREGDARLAATSGQRPTSAFGHGPESSGMPADWAETGVWSVPTRLPRQTEGQTRQET